MSRGRRGVPMPTISKDPNHANIQRMMIDASVREAIESGNPIPVWDAKPDMVFGPPAPIPLGGGRFIRIARFVTLNPKFQDEDHNTGFFLPSFMRTRFTGFLYPADQAGFRPYVMAQVRMEAQLPKPDGSGQVAVKEFPMPFRNELTITEISPERTLEMNRVHAQPWMFLRSSDMPALQDFAQERMTAISEADDPPADPLALLDDESYRAQLQADFVDSLRDEECDFEGCEMGVVKSDDREADCPECAWRGRIHVEEEGQDSTENSASTDPEESGIVGASGEPVNSSD